VWEQFSGQYGVDIRRGLNDARLCEEVQGQHHDDSRATVYPRAHQPQDDDKTSEAGHNTLAQLPLTLPATQHNLMHARSSALINKPRHIHPTQSSGSLMATATIDSRVNQHSSAEAHPRNPTTAKPFLPKKASDMSKHT
jgi:hypothetical protein